MFEMKSFRTSELVAKYIFDYFEQFKWTPFSSESTFNIIHSISQEDIISEQVDFDNLYPQLLEFLRDLDAQEGIYFDNEEGMNFDESPQAQDRIYKEIGTNKKKTEFAFGGEGFLLVKNELASAKDEFPFIVMKPSLYLNCGNIIINSLKFNNSFQDYTSKVIPAIYIQFGEI